MTEQSTTFRSDLFKGRVALVTGGGTGICHAIALALGAQGAHVVITSRRAEHLEPAARAIESLGVRALALPSFAPGRPLAEAAAELMARNHTDFAYRSASTDIDTPQAEVLSTREAADR